MEWWRFLFAYSGVDLSGVAVQVQSVLCSLHHSRLALLAAVMLSAMLLELCDQLDMQKQRMRRHLEEVDVALEVVVYLLALFVIVDSVRRA